MGEIKWQPGSERYTERQILSSGPVYHRAGTSPLSQFMMFAPVLNSSSINYSFLPFDPSRFVPFIGKVRLKNLDYYLQGVSGEFKIWIQFPSN